MDSEFLHQEENNIFPELDPENNEEHRCLS